MPRRRKPRKHNGAEPNVGAWVVVRGPKEAREVYTKLGAFVSLTATADVRRFSNRKAVETYIAVMWDRRTITERGIEGVRETTAANEVTEEVS